MQNNKILNGVLLSMSNTHKMRKETKSLRKVKEQIHSKGRRMEDVDDHASQITKIILHIKEIINKLTTIRKTKRLINKIKDDK